MKRGAALLAVSVTTALVVAVKVLFDQCAPAAVDIEGKNIEGSGDKIDQASEADFIADPPSLSSPGLVPVDFDVGLTQLLPRPEVVGQFQGVIQKPAVVTPLLRTFSRTRSTPVDQDPTAVIPSTDVGIAPAPDPVQALPSEDLSDIFGPPTMDIGICEESDLMAVVAQAGVDVRDAFSTSLGDTGFFDDDTHS